MTENPDFDFVEDGPLCLPMSTADDEPVDEINFELENSDLLELYLKAF